MKVYVLTAAFLLYITNYALAQTFDTQSCDGKVLLEDSNRGRSIQSALNKLTQNQIPGAVAAILDHNGFQVWSSGYARLENQVPMQSCHLQYIQSIAKTYLAVSILQLYEEGRIELEQALTVYLPKQISSLIPNAEKVNVRMLLNHTSGIPEYNYDPRYVTRLLQNPNRVLNPEEYLKYINGKKPDFEPGEKYAYRNSNYLILALIAENITGNHQIYMEERIFKPLGLVDTYYRIAQGEDYQGRLVNNYWDRFSNAHLENISALQNSNVASMIGDDGIITTPQEALTFLKGLMEGQLLKPETLDTMKDWVLRKDGTPAYGLGLTYSKFLGIPAIGHSGGGLGSGCQLYYFPEEDLYMFLGINLGTVTESPIHTKAEEILDEIYMAILK
jgi:D-alanyl-D-alanine carboxypeptidase